MTFGYQLGLHVYVFVFKVVENRALFVISKTKIDKIKKSMFVRFPLLFISITPKSEMTCKIISVHF